MSVLFVGVGLPGCVGAGFSSKQAELQAGVVRRLKGSVVRLLTEATHLVVEANKLPEVVFPALSSLPRRKWPTLHTELWVSECSKVDHRIGWMGWVHGAE